MICVGMDKVKLPKIYGLICDTLCFLEKGFGAFFNVGEQEILFWNFMVHLLLLIECLMFPNLLNKKIFGCQVEFE